MGTAYQVAMKVKAVASGDTTTYCKSETIFPSLWAQPKVKIQRKENHKMSIFILDKQSNLGPEELDK